MTNTYLSLSASTIGVFIISALTSGKTRLTLAHIQVATLAGGVVMSTPSGTPVHPFGALLIGFIAGIVSTLGFKYSQVGYFKPAFPTSSSFSRLYQDMLSMWQVSLIFISTLLLFHCLPQYLSVSMGFTLRTSTYKPYGLIRPSHIIVLKI